MYRNLVGRHNGRDSQKRWALATIDLTKCPLIGSGAPRTRSRDRDGSRHRNAARGEAILPRAPPRLDV